MNKMIRSVVVLLILASIVLAVVKLVPTTIKRCNVDEYVAQQYEAVILKTRLDDTKRSQEVDESLDKLTNSLLSKLEDEAHRKTMKESLKQISDLLTSENETVIESKNKIFLALKKESLQKSAESECGPSTTLLLIIVILSGLLGGFARSQFKDLEYLILESNDLIQKVQDKVSGLSASSVKDDLVLFDEQLNSIVRSQEEIKESIKRPIRPISSADITFGIIASFFSLVLLRSIESQLLTFQEPLDYLVFSVWCIVGALFARKTIESMIGIVQKNKID